MSKAPEREPKRVETIALRSGTFLIRYFDEPSGSVSVEARGPVGHAMAEGALSAAVHYRLVAAAEAAGDEQARIALWKLLRAQGEFPWATTHMSGAAG